MMIATVTVADPDLPGRIGDRLAPLARDPRREDDPDRVDEARREREGEAADRRRVVRVDAADGQHDPDERDAERDPRPPPCSRCAEPDRQDGHDRRVEVDDERGQRRRDRLERRVVRPGVADVQDTEHEAGDDRSAVPAIGAPAAGSRTAAGRPRSAPPRTGTARPTASASRRPPRRRAGRRATRSRRPRPRRGRARPRSRGGDPSGGPS